jgi:CHAD domain-containing protein
MPRYEKSLAGISPERRADEVARAAITERLLAVSHYLEKAIGSTDEAEAIHQLRVWTRRAETALTLFEPTVPKTPRKRMQKRLRKLRRAGGAVRDCDVYLTRLEKEAAQVPSRLIKSLRQQRRTARQELKAIRRRLLKGDRFQTEMARLLETIAWPKRHSSRDAPEFAVFCRQQLTPLGAEFFDLTDADLHDDATLHALRIAGKRLRYALELAVPAIEPDVHRQLYESLDETQDRLGEVVDQLWTIDCLRDSVKGAKKKQRASLQDLMAREQQRLDKLRKKLIRWWSPARRKRLHKLWRQTL